MPLGKHLLSSLMMFETVVGLQGRMESSGRRWVGGNGALASRQTTRSWGARVLAFPACLTPEPCPPPPLLQALLEVNKAAAGELPGRALSACACGQVVWPAVSQHPMISRHNKGIPSPSMDSLLSEPPKNQGRRACLGWAKGKGWASQVAQW